MGTEGTASMTRQSTASDLERDLILAALRLHNGNVSKVAAQLRIPLRTMSKRMATYQLHEEADALRAMARIPGRRRTLPDGVDPEGRKVTLMTMLEENEWNHVAAYTALGIPRRTWFKELKRLGITKEAHARRFEEMRDRLTSALSEARGVQLQAAKLLGVSHTCVMRWCRRFKIDPSIFAS